MALRGHLVSTASRSLVYASRRCRTAKDITDLSSLRWVASSPPHACSRVEVRDIEILSRPSLKPSRLVKKRSGRGEFGSRGCLRVRERGQSRALSMDPAPTPGEGKGGDAEGASASTSKEVFIRAGGEFGTDGDPGPPPPLDPSIVTGPSEKVLKVMDDIDSLDVMEVTMLIDVFKERLGLDEVPSLNFDTEGGEAGEAGGAPEAAEKSAFNVNVTGFDEKSKIKVIKEIRAITGLGLREAKELVESLPKVIKKDMKKEEGEKIVKTLEAVGATVTLE